MPSDKLKQLKQLKHLEQFQHPLLVLFSDSNLGFRSANSLLTPFILKSVRAMNSKRFLNILVAIITTVNVCWG
jgi:hypothetical protein